MGDIAASKVWGAGQELTVCNVAPERLLVKKTIAIIRTPDREGASFEGEGGAEIRALVFAFRPILNNYFWAVHCTLCAGDLVVC